MSIKVSQYLVTKTPAQSSHQDTEGEILGILRIIFHNIFNSDWGSSTKKIKKIFSRICVFIFQILLVGWSSEFCGRSLTYICIISEQSLEIKHIPFPHVAPAFLSSSCQTTHNCKDESTEKWRKVSEFLVSGYDGGTVTPNTENVTLLIVFSVGILIVWNVGIQLHAGHHQPPQILLFSSPISLIGRMRSVMRKTNIQ